MNGVGGLKNTIKSLIMELARGEEILLIVDADESYENRRIEVKKLIDTKNINFFIMPNNRDNGDMETLLLSTIKNNSVSECFNEYISCLESKDIETTKINNKAKLYAYTTLTFKQSPSKSLNNFDLGHSNFDKLKIFLNK